MGMVAILVMWPSPPAPEQNFIPPTYGGSTWNLASIGSVLLEKMMFENGGRQRPDNDGWSLPIQ